MYLEHNVLIYILAMYKWKILTRDYKTYRISS